ncbi:MAG: energy transducer TonB [Bdellovibrionales bacterium]
MIAQREASVIQSRFISKSIALHVALVLVFTVKAYLFPTEPIVFENAIRVDIVGLPDKKQVIIEDKVSAPPAPSKSTPAPVEEKKVVIKPKAQEKAPAKEDLKKAQKKALEKLKALEALNNIQDEVTEQSQRGKQSAIAGNTISQGSALKGIQQNQIAGYISNVERHVKQNWDLPQWMSEAQLKARAHVFIDKRGIVTKRMIVASSGNTTYDELVLNAIDKSSPFPAPPAVFADLFSTKGFVLGFPD